MHFWDERVRETMRPLGAGVFRLEGPVSGRQSFSQARRIDGNPVQSGDTTTICAVQEVSGSRLAVVAAAELTLGGSNTLTIDQAEIRMSTNAGSLPSFDVNNTGEIFCTWSMAEMAGLIDPYTLKLINKKIFRANIAVPILTGAAGAFDAEDQLANNEAAIVLGAAKLDDFAAGIFVQNDTAQGTVDGVDIVSNPNAAGGRGLRVNMKTARTNRGNAIAAGGTFPLLQAPPLGSEWWIHGWKQSDPSVFVSGYFLGTSSAPTPYGVTEHTHDGPELTFDITGNDISIRNNAVAASSVDYVMQRIG